MTGGDGGGSCNGIRVLAARVTQYSATPHTTFQTKQSAARCQHTAEFIRNGCFYSETNFIGNTHTFTAANTFRSLEQPAAWIIHNLLPKRVRSSTMLVKATLPLVGNKKHSLIHNQHKRPNTNKFLSQFRQHSLPQNRSSCDAKDPYNVIKLKSLQNHNTMRANILFPGSYAGRVSQLFLTILRMKLFMLTFVVNTGVGQLTSG